ncbi:MAG TPA: hypothetical protein VFS43_08065 [Polyangiaceae bacterium]|nr:hypothetical protein [Polyangiaceae bacterium]
MKSLFLTSFAALVLAGCSSTPPVQPNPDRPRDDNDDDDDGGVEAPVDPAPGAPEIIAGVRQLFEAKCVGCHGGDFSAGGLGNIFDVDELKNKRLITDKADSSPLFNRIKDGDHPASGTFNLTTKKPTQQPNDLEIGFVANWIDSGAPSLRGNRSIRDVAAFADKFKLDLSSFSRAVQNNIFYVSFHVEYNNPDYSDAELTAAANAVLKLVNQLDPNSNGPSTVGDGFGIVFDDNGVPMGMRVEFDRLGLLQEDVDLIARLSNRDDNNNPLDCAVRAFPLKDFIRIAASDDNFDPFNNEINGGYSNIVLIKLLQKAGIAQPGDQVFAPIAEADFLANNSSNVSNFTNLQILEALDPLNLNAQALDALFNELPDNEKVTRVCTNQSNVSAANRCIDNFYLSNGGIGFQSYDVLSFNNANGNKDFAALAFFGPEGIVRPVGNAVPFAIDGGEFIGQLNNGSLLFTVYNATFNLVSNPPTLAVLNPNNPERGNEISVQACSSCHASLTIPIKSNIDDVLNFSLNGFDSNAVGFITKIKANQETIDRDYQIEQQKYLDILRRTYFSRSETGQLGDAIFTFAASYDNDLTLNEVSANLGSEAEVVLNLINNDVDLSRQFAALGAGTISRENFTLGYQNLIKISSSNETFLKACLLTNVELDQDEQPVEEQQLETGRALGRELPAADSVQAMARAVRRSDGTFETDLDLTFHHHSRTKPLRAPRSSGFVLS